MSENTSSNFLNGNNKKLFKNYFIFFSGQQISILGSTIVQFVLIWWVTLETGSELILGLASLAGFGPLVFIGPFAGVISDRINRKLVIVAADTLIAVITGVAIYLFYMDKFTIAWLFIVLVVRGVGDSFHNTIVMSILPTMIPKEQISRINGLNYLTNGIIRIAGPALAAALLIVWSTVDLMWADIITYVIATALILLVKIPTVSTKIKKGEKIKFFADLKEALKTLISIKGLLAIGILLIVVNFFFTPFNTLLPLFVYKTHGGLETDYALLIFFFQAGIIAGSIFMSVYKGFKRKAWISYIAIMWTFFVLTTLSFIPGTEPSILETMGVELPLYFITRGRSTLFGVMGIQFFIATLVHPIINVSLLSGIQLVVPEEKLGRISGFIATEVNSVMPLAMIVGGGIGEVIGIRSIYLFSGILGIVICSLIWFLTKARLFDKEIAKRMEEGAEVKPPKLGEQQELVGQAE
jgi:DHA3 family macrolide efflux protein-like MFS transporter